MQIINLFVQIVKNILEKKDKKKNEKTKSI